MGKLITRQKIINHYKQFFGLQDMGLAEGDNLTIDWAESLIEACVGKQTLDELSNCNKPLVTNCVALPEWLSKERCAVAAGIWNSHQEGDNKRVQAIQQIKAWAADAGYEIGFKKANELFKQHCL